MAIGKNDPQVVEKIEAVKELTDLFLLPYGDINDLNYLKKFDLILEKMIIHLGFDREKSGIHVNNRFSQYLNDEFLPQYASLLGFNLKEYQIKVKNSLGGNLNF